jgi:hypothetical protein
MPARSRAALAIIDGERMLRDEDNDRRRIAELKLRSTKQNLPTKSGKKPYLTVFAFRNSSRQILLRHNEALLSVATLERFKNPLLKSRLADIVESQPPS